MKTAEERKAYHKAYRESHKEQRKAYLEEHREEIYAKNREWYKEYAKTHRERILETKRAYRKKHPKDRSGYNRQKKYNLSPEEFTEMHLAQDHKCKTCGCVLGPGYRTHVDHDHHTGRVRGLLCNRCNRAIGFISDDPTVASNIAQYLLDNQTASDNTELDTLPHQGSGR